MKAFILKTSEEIIAVIKFIDQNHFYRTIRIAISEHYTCDIQEVKIIGESHRILEIETIEEGEECIRDYILIETYVY